MRIKVLGGTGYAGSHIVREAAARGHEVTSYSRNLPTEPVEGVTYRNGSVFDDEFLRDSVTDTDVVFDALSPRGDLEGKLEGVVDRLIAVATEAGVRLGVLGGASSLLVAPGGPRLLDVTAPPAEVLPEINAGIAILDTLQTSSPEQLDWFYVSPAQTFGAWVPGEATGKYRVGGDVLLVDEKGESFISGADLAMAVLDEIETPTHRRRRFSVAY